RATGDTGRSLCSLVCKWTYLGHKAEGSGTKGWSDDYWSGIGLDDIVKEGYRRVGTRVRALGEPVGDGLSEKAARELRLQPGTPVSASIIDAHAGGLGVLGMDLGNDVNPERWRLAWPLSPGPPLAIWPYHAKPNTSRDAGDLTIQQWFPTFG